jgi:hypothetical protein
MGAPSPELCNLWLAQAFNAQNVEAATAMYHRFLDRGGGSGSRQHQHRTRCRRHSQNDDGIHRYETAHGRGDASHDHFRRFRDDALTMAHPGARQGWEPDGGASPRNGGAPKTAGRNLGVLH